MKNLLLCLLACSLLVFPFLSCELDENDESGGSVEDEDCELVPDTLKFGGVFIGDYLDLTTRLCTRYWPPEIVENDCDGYWFIDPSTGDPVEILDFNTVTFEYEQPRYCTDVEIRFAPLTLGVERCEIEFEYNTGEATKDCPTLVLEGGGIEECGFSQSSLEFPTPIPVGEYADLTVQLYVLVWPPDNPTLECDDFLFVDPITQETVSTLDFSHPSYPFDYSEVTESYRTNLTIRFAPLTEGTKNCTLDIARTGENAYDCPTLDLNGIGAVPTDLWTLFDPVTTYDLKDVYGDKDRVIACGDMGTVVRHTHGDSYFSVWMEEDFDEIPLEAIWVDTVIAFNTVWVGGGIVDGGSTYGRLFSNSDGSTTWNEVVLYPEFTWHLDKVTAIWGSTTCEKFYGGIAYSGMMSTMYRWNCIELVNWLLGDGYTEITGIHGCTSNNAWATLANPYQYGERVYHYDGSGWTMNQETWMDQACYDVWAAPGGNQAWVVGANGAIYHWTGSSWEDQSISGETRTIYGIWGFSSIDIYAVGENGLFYHYDGTWTERPVGGGGISETLYAVWGLDNPDRIYAVGTNGTTIRHIPIP